MKCSGKLHLPEFIHTKFLKETFFFEIVFLSFNLLNKLLQVL